MLGAAGVSVTGPGHVSLGQANQDAIALRGWRGGWIAAVADGLGSRPLSGLGSRLAVQAAQQTIRSMPTEMPLRAWEPRQTATEFYRRWLRAVPYADKSCVASTILMAACGRDGIGRVWQLGDGLVACRSKGNFSVVTPERLGFGNETRALGIHRAWSDWCTADVALQERGDAVILMTDGISDDVRIDALEMFTDALVRGVMARTRRGARGWLRNELVNWSTPNHTDDKTVAVIFKG